MSNFIPIEIVTIDDRDPPRINNKIKSLMKKTVNILNKCRTLLEQVLKFLSKSIISNTLENLQLINQSQMLLVHIKKFSQ